MKISQIRDTIQTARWVRCDFGGHTREEFMRADVPARLNDQIAKIEALVIPARFVEDIARRNEEVVYCRTVIERWNRYHAEGAKNPKPTQVLRADGSKSHIRLVYSA